MKKGCCKTFWIKGKRIRAPVLLSYFFSIFTSPVKKRNVDLINQDGMRCETITIVQFCDLHVAANKFSWEFDQLENRQSPTNLVNSYKRFLVSRRLLHL